MRKIKRYGWIPDLPDNRDFKFAAPPVALPPKVDLRPACPPVYDQGQLGSCTANAIGAAHQFEQIKQDAKAAFIPSRLFIYYNERSIEHTVDQDSGGMLRDGLKSVAQQGVCPETDWPYVITKFTNKPTPTCYKEAKDNQVTSYQSVAQTPDQMKSCLALGYPFVLGFSVYESFESPAVAKSGIVPMPKKGEKMLGGHAVLVVGYDDSQSRFIVRNSWGTGWGQAGYFMMPYDYFTNPNLASDFWTIRLVEVEG
jgi:C1A family cysteine protease